MPRRDFHRLLPYPQAALFGLLEDVERYPEFMPGWKGVEVLQREPQRVWVRQRVGSGPLAISFRSTALFTAPERIDIEVLDGPGGGTLINWLLAEEAAATRLALSVTTPGEAGLMRLLNIFAPPPERILDAFAARARRVLGSG